jgi:hypothetical protein
MHALMTSMLLWLFPMYRRATLAGSCEELPFSYQQALNSSQDLFDENSCNNEELSVEHADDATATQAVDRKKRQT